MLKPHARDQKVCKKKNLPCLFGADSKIRSSGSLFGITRHSLEMPNIDPRKDFFIGTKKDLLNIKVIPYFIPQSEIFHDVWCKSEKYLLYSYEMLQELCLYINNVLFRQYRYIFCTITAALNIVSEVAEHANENMRHGVSKSV